MQTLDPTIVSLARAIKSNETGSGDTYNAPPGPDGEQGAYRWVRGQNFDTWANGGKYYPGASQILGDANAPMSMDNQNKVAYEQIKSMKDKGFNPGQIASIWNSGSPDHVMDNHSGTSMGGANYNTPQYVSNVYKKYQEFKGGSSPQGSGYVTPPPMPQIPNDVTGGVTNTPQNQADQSSAQQYGANFPSQTGEGAGMAGIKALGNVSSSFMNLGKNLGGIALHPVQTVEGIGNAVIGGAEKAYGGITGNPIDNTQTQTFDSLSSSLKDRYGSLENLQRTATNDPAGFGLDVLTLLYGGSKLVDSARSITPEGKAIDLVKERIKHSEPFKVQEGISMKEPPRELVYKEGNLLRPEFAQGRIDDIAQKLNIFKPTLGDKFRSLVDANNVTMIGNVPEPLVKIANQLVDDSSTVTGALKRGISQVGQLGLYPLRQSGNLLKNTSSIGLGVTTGEGVNTLKNAIESSFGSPESRQAFKAGYTGKVSPEQIVEEAQTGMDKIKEAQRTSYQNQLAKIADNTKSYDISPLHDSLDEWLKKFNIEVSADGSLDFSRSKIANTGSARADVQGVYDTIKSWGKKTGDRTPIGLDTLKQQLDDFYSPSGKARAFVQGVKSSLWNPENQSGVLSNVKGYGKLTGDYSDTANFIKDLKSSLSIGGKAGIETTFKKLTTAMKGNSKLKTAFIKELDSQVGGGLLSKLSGSRMSAVLPQGIVGAIEGLGGIEGVIHGVFPQIIPLLTVASPRVVASFLNALGYSASKIEGIMSKLDRLVPAVAGGNLINRAQGK